MDPKVAKIAKNVRLLILDVDGVLTDGGIIFDSLGNEIKVFNVRDGHGIKLIQQVGIKVVIITGRSSDVVSKRAAELGIEDIYQGVINKAVAYEKVKAKYGFSDEVIACIGDDINDITLFKKAYLPIAVNDAAEELKPFAKYITTKDGGKGAVREVCELLLKSQGFWQKIIDEYIQS
ncbi:MAG: HAD hydrolase family protein [Thermodesulfovibrionales bacterium]|nr:HAD hydrolase family protein [Thermodesulfovibrionales bacterium]